MEGGNDPDNRRCMEWDKVNKNKDIVNYRRNLNSMSLYYPKYVKANRNSITYGNEKFQIVLTRDYVKLKIYD